MVPHEVTLLAFTRNEDGTLCICDIVETSRHFAPRFVSRFRRMRDCYSVAAIAPKTATRDYREYVFNRR